MKTTRRNDLFVGQRVGGADDLNGTFTGKVTGWQGSPARVGIVLDADPSYALKARSEPGYTGSGACLPRTMAGMWKKGDVVVVPIGKISPVKG